LVKPKIPKERQRGRSQVKAAMGVPSPQSTIDCGDHQQLVKRSKDNPINVFLVDQIVIHDNQDKEYFIKLFPGMCPGHLKAQIEKYGISKIDKIWFNFSKERESEFQQLIEKMWPKFKKQRLPDIETGIKQIKGGITFKVTDHYFRSLAKIAFHYYLTRSRRGFRGDEQCFDPIRDFIMNGGNDKVVFKQPGPTFAVPFGEIPSGGVVTPNQWCHIIAADETDKVAVVYLQLFVGCGCVPQPHYIKLADIDSNILVPNSTWGHVYLYDESPRSDRYAGQVEQAQITRIR
jgi:hypothetical protein